MNNTMFFKYLGIKNPTFREVSPWLRILSVLDKWSTISAAEHPGFLETYSVISIFKRSNLAFFCEPLPFMYFNRVADYIVLRRVCPGPPSRSIQIN